MYLNTDMLSKFRKLEICEGLSPQKLCKNHVNKCDQSYDRCIESSFNGRKAAAKQYHNAILTITMTRAA